MQQVASCKLQVASYELRVEGLRVFMRLSSQPAREPARGEAQYALVQQQEERRRQAERHCLQ